MRKSGGGAMQNSERTILISVLICTGFVPVSSARTARSKARPAHPTAFELLDKYATTQDKVKSFTLRYEDQYRVDNKISFIPGREKRRLRKGGYIGDLRSDGTRHYIRQKLWEESRPHLPANKALAESDPRFVSTLWDGEQRYQYLRSNVQAKNDKLFLNLKGHEGARGDDIITTCRSRALLGFFEDTYNLAPYGYKRVDSELRSAHRFSVRSKMENVGGSKCYVIDARTKDSTYKLWIDPEHSYHISKAEISRGGPGIEWGKPEEVSLFTYLRNVRFERIDDVWAPIETDYGFDRTLIKGGFEKEDHHHKITEFKPDPDHNAMRSFVPDDVRNGTRVSIIGVKGKTYTWQDGQVVDKDGKVIIDSTRKNKGDSKQSQSEVFGKKAPSAWDLLRKERQKRLQAAGGDNQRATDQAKPRSPMAWELLDRCTQALDSFRSIVVKTEIASEFEWRYDKNWHEPVFRGRADKGRSYKRTEFRTDGRRIHSREYTWGHISPMDPSVPKERPFYNLLNYVNKQVYRHSAQTAPDARGLVLVYQRPDFTMRDLLSGYAIQSEERADAILRRAESICVRPKTEPIGGSDCYAIDAETDSGRISVWIDPAHGHQLAKVEARGTEGDLYWGKPLPRGQQVNSRLENVRFEKVDGIWVPAEADIRMENHYGRGSFSINKRHYKRTQILLNPDHDALGSFDNPLENPKNDPLLRNGTKVRITTDSDRKRYIWQDGKLIPDKDRRTPR